MRPRIVVLSGLSGAGKTTGVHALEDQGYYCVDNLPVDLVRSFLDLCERNSEIEKIALVIDIREGEFLRGAADTVRQLRAQGYSAEVLFLEADEDVLVRRFQETRRRHPAAATNETIRSAIARERELLLPLRDLSDGVLDTSNLNVHQLRRAIRERYGSREGERLHVALLSFGFKYGLPPEADMVLDVRFLPNPYFVEALRPKTGREAEVARYVLEEAGEFLERAEGLLAYLLPRYLREGKASFTLAVGCTGGRHRSVAIVEELARRLGGGAPRPAVVHRDVERG
jgi:RNase adapter protein RapZ